MSYDDYVGVIGSFCWYMYERIPGFDPAREPHPLEAGAEDRDKIVELLADWGGVINSGEVSAVRSAWPTSTGSLRSTRPSR